jgi:hypothetical protein
MALIWNAPVGKTADLLETSGKRELFWYGVTVGQVGVGLLVSRERQPTKRAADVSQVALDGTFRCPECWCMDEHVSTCSRR